MALEKVHLFDQHDNQDEVFSHHLSGSDRFANLLPGFFFRNHTTNHS